MSEAIERESMEFDVVIVGGGARIYYRAMYLSRRGSMSYFLIGRRKVHPSRQRLAETGFIT